MQCVAMLFEEFWQPLGVNHAHDATPARLIRRGFDGSRRYRDPATSANDVEWGAFDVCRNFVRDRLVSPASFPNFFEDDGAVIGDVYAGLAEWTATT